MWLGQCLLQFRLALDVPGEARAYEPVVVGILPQEPCGGGVLSDSSGAGGKFSTRSGTPEASLAASRGVRALSSAGSDGWSGSGRARKREIRPRVAVGDRSASPSATRRMASSSWAGSTPLPQTTSRPRCLGLVSVRSTPRPSVAGAVSCCVLPLR